MTNFNSPIPHLFAHRGGNAAGKKNENTLSAFQAAVDLGCNFLETDVIATKDNQAITYHGSANFIMKLIFDLEIRRKIQKLTHSQVKSTVKPGGKNIPKFEDVLLKFKKQSFCVDIKTDEAIRPFVEAVKKTKAKDRIIITSFSKKRSIRANKLLYGEDFDKACLCVYRTKGRFLSIFPGTVISRLKRQGFGYIHIPYRCVTKKLIKEAKKQNFKLYAWTVNKEDEMKKLLSWKIDGIISDEIEILIKSAKS